MSLAPEIVIWVSEACVDHGSDVMGPVVVLGTPLDTVGISSCRVAETKTLAISQVILFKLWIVSFAYNAVTLKFELLCKW